MAGAGYKLFNTGDVLTAAQVNTYLQEQTVMVFADSSARSTALSGVISEGMISYLQDTNAVEYYDGSSWVAVGTPPDGGDKYAAGKNKLLNGNMATAQRGTSFTSTNSANNDDAYTLDRWYILSDGNDAIDVTRSTQAPTNGLYSIGLDVETINKKFGIAQIVEQVNCQGLVGQTVTLSFKAKVSATTKLDNVKAAIVAWSGTANSVTSDIISAWNVEGTNPTLIANATYENTPANLNVTTSWASYSISAAVDTASTKNIIAFIWSDVTDTTAGDFLYITDVQLENGSTATEFQTATGNDGAELAACLRYYNAVSTVGHTAYSAVGCMGFVYPTVMRATPTATFSYSGVANRMYNIQTGATSDLVSPTISVTAKALLNFYAFTPTNWAVAAGTGFTTQWILDAEL